MRERRQSLCRSNGRAVAVLSTKYVRFEVIGSSGCRAGAPQRQLAATAL
jgi:hypothetical protein